MTVGQAFYRGRDFASEYRRLQRERVAAFGEFIADVHDGRFPEPANLVEMKEDLLAEVVRSVANGEGH